MNVSLKTDRVSFKDALELANGLTAEEKLRLIERLLPSMSRAELSSLLKAIANQI